MKAKPIPEKLTLAYEAFKEANAAGREWDSLVSRSIARYGARPNGGHISGIYSEHFPKRLQNRLHRLARAVSMFSDMAYSLRPKGVRASTMRALREQVIASFGRSYYG